MRDRLLVLTMLMGLAVASLTASAAATAVQGSPSVDRADLTSGGGRTAAETLAKAKHLLSSTSTTSSGVGGSDATMVLRDLAHQAGALATSGQRAVAGGILARPTDTGSSSEPVYDPSLPVGRVCGAHVCVHWIEDTDVDTDSVPRNDFLDFSGFPDPNVEGDVNTVPGYVTRLLDRVERAYSAEVDGLGYRPPLPDTGTVADGGNKKLDFYIADTGAFGFTGYCVPETNARASYGYCMLDNDYIEEQFEAYGTGNPVHILEAAAAHQLFHLVQFGYDSHEDAWLLGGTAAWIEDEVYDDSDYYWRYEYHSQLHRNGIPLDSILHPGFAYYSWVFWRFLSESSVSGAASDPDIVREVWEKAADPGYYSTRALQAVLHRRGSSFAQKYTTFAVWNRDPGRYYTEGENYYHNLNTRDQLPNQSFALTAEARSTGRRTIREVDHMTNRAVRFTHGSTLSDAWKIRVSVNLPSLIRGSRARVIVRTKAGEVINHPVPLNAYGNGQRDVDFSSDSISNVELIIVNASTRFTCNQGTQYTCSGISRDDGNGVSFTGTAFR